LLPNNHLKSHLKTILTSDGKKGGSLAGKSHAEGGIKAVVVDTKRPIEVESGEVIINKYAAKKHWKKLSEINQSAGNGVPIEEPIFEKGGNFESDDKKEIYKKWKQLVNMSYSELKDFYESKEGKEAGLTKSEAIEHGIHRGRESAQWVMKMKKTPMSEWTLAMWRWAKRQISFISRMSGVNGDLYDDKGNKTRKHTSLLIWGHNPVKYEKGNLIKRADGSYSKHGLWDSIRENSGSGKKPTKEMLEQEAKIKNKLAQGGLIAPNGNASNLTPEQYKLVRTPAFKKWFGDWENDPQNSSKVVDGNGEPMVVYHGTYVKEQFNIFDFDKADLGFHFGTYEQAKERSQTKMYVQGYRSIINPYFLNIRTLSNITDIGDWEYPQRYIDMLVSDNLITEKEAKQNGFYNIFYREDNKLVREFLINKFGNIGFDYQNKIESKGMSYIVLQPNQIKLADGTNTTFDGNNPDIRYEDGGMLDKNCFDFINKTEAILTNGYYHRFDNFCLITYNSGNQKNLNVYQTVNMLLGKKLSELLQIDYEAALTLIFIYYDEARRFDTLEILQELEGCNIIVADRDEIVCANDMQYAKGGSITCSNCNWSWDKKDTQPHDAYVCHKCGTDNEMKYGGDVDKVKKYIVAWREGNHKWVIDGDTLLSKIESNKKQKELKKEFKSKPTSVNIYEFMDFYNNIWQGGMFPNVSKPEKVLKLHSDYNKMKPEQSAEYIAKEHLKEDPEYYTKLKKIDENFKTGGSLTNKQKAKLGKVLREFYANKLYSSSGDLVKDKRQALAIAYSEAKNI